MNKEAKIVYRFKNALYINLTNRCPNACVFCLKNPLAMKFEGYNLNLEGKEPSAQDVLGEIYRNLKEFAAQEIVFCGYGEPTMRLDVLLEAALELKKKISKGKLPAFKIRLNTIGLANLVYGRDITGGLAKVIDKVNVSLNSPYEEQWRALVRPAPRYVEKGYQSALDFIKLCAQKIDEVEVSIVDKQGIDADKMRELARSLGAKFYLRGFIDGK
ncbi:MAG: TatD family nuclease-associated radical SAM protein [Elusimicrobiota bacterium]|jgi:TatD DNase family protein|nr:TatD family nuclease-associated radical SAM protein [Elusimicrobiota bacterium]